jgi:transcriptional regulator with XRE-family HTH domain
VDTEEMTTGERIHTYRRRYKLSLAALGEQIGVSESTISGYEHDLLVPGGKQLRGLSLFFGVTVDYLLGLSDSPQDYAY